MDEFKNYLEKYREVGYIVSLSHSIAYISGLPSLKLMEMVITESGKIGITSGLGQKSAEILMTDVENLKVGERVVKTGKELEIRIGEGLLGRMINPFCQPIDGQGPIRGKKEYQKIKRGALTFIERKRINKPLETGVTMVDLLVPIGYGQRELVIGDAKTGKTTFLLQSISSQAKKGVICIYVGIGKKDTALKWVEEYLKNQRILDKVVIIHTTPDDSPTLIYLAPYTGMTIAEYFRDQGKNVLIILDDLTTHAKVYREISLLLKRNPGRDSYPGDIFHIQAELMERAGNIKFNGKEVSITALPVAETLENDLSGYIQTNLMAMTDGHIFFDINEFRKGKRPAINTFLSVSRVGNQTKTQIEKNLADWIRKKMIEYQRAMEISQFGAELPVETQKTIELGQRLEIFFSQAPVTIIPRELQIFWVGLLISDFWKDKSLMEMKAEVLKILKEYQKGNLPKLPEEIEKIKNLEHLQFLIKEILAEVEKII